MKKSRAEFFRAMCAIAGVMGVAGVAGAQTLLFSHDFTNLGDVATAGGTCVVGSTPCTSATPSPLISGVTGTEMAFPQSAYPKLTFPAATNIDKLKGTIRFKYRPLGGSAGDWSVAPTNGDWTGFNPAPKVLFRLFDTNFSNRATLKIGTHYNNVAHRNYFYFRYDGTDGCTAGWSTGVNGPACAREVHALDAEPGLSMTWLPDSSHTIVATWDFTGSKPFMALSVDGLGGNSLEFSTATPATAANAPDLDSFAPSVFYVGSDVSGPSAHGAIDNLEIFGTPLPIADPIGDYVTRTDEDGVWQPHEVRAATSDAPAILALSEPFIFFNSYAFERIDEGYVPPSAIDATSMDIEIARDQRETAFFNIYSGDDPLGEVTASIDTPLAGSSGSIPLSQIKIRAVKNWWQAGTAIAVNKFVPVYTPELLLYDDARTGKFGCSGTTSERPCLGGNVFPQDPRPSQPSAVTLVAPNTSRQFAVTIDIPTATAPGSYSGFIDVATDAGNKSLPINVVVKRFALPAIDKTVALYTNSQDHNSAADHYVPPTQYTAQLLNMREHGVNGLMFGGELYTSPRRYPDYSWPSGFDRLAAYPFYTSNRPLIPQELSNAAALVGGLVAAGYQDAYLYGEDEPSRSTIRMAKHLAESKAIHESCTTGLSPNRCGKVVVAITKDWADKLNDPGFFPYEIDEVEYELEDVKLDLPNLSAEVTTEPESVAYFTDLLGGDHSEKPGRPELYYWQMFREEPRINRFYAGYHLWLTDLTGVMPYTYQRVLGDPFDDFSTAAGSERDTMTTYPSAEGPIDTIQWEAFRAGLDDYRALRYWRTLQDELSVCSPAAATFQGRLNAIVGKYRHREAFASISRVTFAADRSLLFELIDDMLDVRAKKICTHGLTGSYYNNLNLSGTANPRTDANVDFDWVMASPMPGTIATEDFSISWTGRIVPPVTGTYQFCTTSDDGARLWVDDMVTPIVDKWIDQAVTPWCGTVDLVANEPVPIRLDFYDTLEEAVIKLSWSYPGQSDVVVPSSALYAE